MATTLAQLLQAQTQTQLFQALLGIYQAQGFPVQSWEEFGVERTRLMAITKAFSDTSANYIPQIAAGGLLDEAVQLEDPGWLRLLSEQNYSLPYNAASYTVGTIRLSNASGSPYTIAARKLIAVFGASGNRYVNTGTGTLSASGGTLDLLFEADSPGAKYNDPSSSGAISLVSPLLGVTLSNPAGVFSDVVQIGAGTGTLTLGGSPVGPHQTVVRIDSTGASGVATWSYSLDGGSFTSAGAAATLSNLGGFGINVTLVNGASGTSFVQNDTYTFVTPGSWISTQGADDETALTLAQRCRDRWSSLSTIPVTNLYQLLAMSTPTVGSQVTQCIVVPDPDINNKVNIVVAGPAGPLPPAAVATIQAFMSPLAAQGDFPTVVSPSTTAITFIAVITAYAAQLLSAQAAIETALNNYVASIGINGTLRIAAVYELIMQVAGVIDVASVTINGGSVNLTLGGVGSYVMPAYPPTLTFSYVTL